jgi:sugar phosphate isomerase/epimerase
VIVCVENMPPGVYPGSRMAELGEILRELDHPQLALALDTGHANLTASAAEETLAAGSLLATTHVHDNAGRQDSHEPPGHGTVDWTGWGRALDQIGYAGPVLLECIRFLRHNRWSYRPDVLAGLVGRPPEPSPGS